MIGLVIGTFVVGGFFGMLGMAILSCGPKTELMRENKALKNQLTVMVKSPEKSFKAVKDPRLHVYHMVN